jgi:uncharacterized protein (DUF1330 family)
MAVYSIGLLKFKDIAAYRKYQAAFPAVFGKFKGKVVVADEAPVTQGDLSFDKVVVLEFPDAAEAQRFATSPEYRAISVDRDKGADVQVLLVKGFEPKAG